MVSYHAFSEFCHRDTLSCMGPKNPGHTGRELKGIRPEFSGGLFLPVRKTAPDRSPHPAAKPLPPRKQNAPFSQFMLRTQKSEQLVYSQ